MHTADVLRREIYAMHKKMGNCDYASLDPHHTFAEHGFLKELEITS